MNSINKSLFKLGERLMSSFKESGVLSEVVLCKDKYVLDLKNKIVHSDNKNKSLLSIKSMYNDLEITLNKHNKCELKSLRSGKVIELTFLNHKNDLILGVVEDKFSKFDSMGYIIILDSSTLESYTIDMKLFNNPNIESSSVNIPLNFGLLTITVLSEKTVGVELVEG